MPDLGLGDRVTRQIAQWFRREFGRDSRRLGPKELKHYDLYAAGWAVTVTLDGVEYEFYLLLDNRFPFSQPRVALARPDRKMQWPHVENQGLLCLPPLVASAADPTRTILDALVASYELVKKCATDAAFVRSELAREFISYWNRSTAGSADIWSLVDPTGPVREVFVWHGKNYYLVADTEARLQQWLKNAGFDKEVSATKGLYAPLPSPPIPPYPEGISEFVDLVGTAGQRATDILVAQALIQRPSLFLLSARTETGTGLVGVSFEGGLPRKGFRPPEQMSASQRMTLLPQFSKPAKHEVRRVDSSWVNGRDKNDAQPLLETKRVSILGCGALGSHVAVRLAQAGVGELLLVDADGLNAANVSRHVLGLDQAGTNKARALSDYLRRHFPHMRAVEGVRSSWQHLTDDTWKRVAGSDLILSATADWASEAALTEWQFAQEKPRPIVYCWIEPEGAGAHAFCSVKPGPCLACLLDDEGDLREPIIEWDKDKQLTEPACGAVYIPCGPIELARAEALVGEMCITALTDAPRPRYRVYATTTTQLTSVGGKWTAKHLKRRPEGFEERFEYEEAVERGEGCSVCGGKSG